jgi:hypothetical protein
MKQLFIALTFIISSSLFANDNCHEIVSNIITKSVTSKKGTAKKVVLSLDSTIGTKVFERTRDNFLEGIDKGVDGKDFEQVIKDLKNDELTKELKKDNEQYEAAFKDLKFIRKNAAILRSVFVVFSSEHISPASFEKFTKELGKLNDTLDFKAWQMMPDAAKKVRKSFDREAIQLELDTFLASSPASVKSQLDEVKHEVIELLEKDKVNVNEFHETRKLLKHFLASVQMIIEVEDRNELRPAYKFLNELNDELGNMRDEVLEKEIKAQNKGKKFDEDSVAELIPKRIKTSILDFFNNFEVEINN